MPTNDQTVLDQVLSTERADRFSELSDSEFFELFVAEQILKDRDLSYDEIESGIVDGGKDGAVDAIYTFVDDELAREDGDFSNARKGVAIELVVIQSKREASFREVPVDRLAPTLSDLLPLGTNRADFGDKYRGEVLDGFALFRQVVKQTASRAASIHIRVVYACRGITPDPAVVKRKDFVEKVVQGEFPSATFTFEFMGATDLLEAFRRQPMTTFELPIVEAIAPATPGMVCLVRLGDYVGLITDAKGALRTAMFDANVRDYQGDVEVNRAIADTLRRGGSEDFWWLNNGITILADRTTQASKTLSIESPQIVNGLQTSYEIHRYFREESPEDEGRHLLIRIINVTDDDTRDRIIRATNSQTAIQPASLRATDPVHRSIEDLLKGYGLYYERRKNFYKNRGMPKARIISIGYLAQAVTSCLLFESNTARARPGTLLKRDADYERVFSEKHPIQLYRVSVEIMLRVDAYLASHATLSRYERTNYRHHVAAVVSAILRGNSESDARAVASIDLAEVDDSLLTKALGIVEQTMTDLSRDGRALDEVSKSSDIVPALIAALGEDDA